MCKVAYSIFVLLSVLLVSCGGLQTSKESLEQSSTIKSWDFNSDFSDEKALALLANKLIAASSYKQFEYVDSGYAGAHKRLDADVSGSQVSIIYSYHPRGDAANEYYSKSAVVFPIDIVRENNEAYIFLHSPSEFNQENTQGELIVTETDVFAPKVEILSDARHIFQSFAVTALERRLDGEGIQKYVDMSPGLVALELYVSTGCEVVVESVTANICEFEQVFFEAWVSTQGEGSILAIDFFQDYVVRGADALALDKALEQLEQAQKSMLNTLNLSLTE